MSGLTKLSLKELYDLKESLDGEDIEKVEDEIDSRSEEEFDQYHWPEDDIDPAGGRGLASHV